MSAENIGGKKVCQNWQIKLYVSFADLANYLPKLFSLPLACVYGIVIYFIGHTSVRT